MEAVVEESVEFYRPQAGAGAARDCHRNPTVGLWVVEGGTAIDTVPASACARVLRAARESAVEASARAAEAVVDSRVCRRSATGGGDAEVLRHRGVSTVEFGFGTQTAHGADEHTTTGALVRNATSYAAVPTLYSRLVDRT
jgi:succinyl-diaminopimelate desuccinylase